MYGLKEETIRNINSIFSTHPQIEEAILYGSRAKGNYKDGSDIDLTLKGDFLKLEVMNKIGLQLDDLLLPYTIDISVYKSIRNPDLLNHIKRVGIIFYKKRVPTIQE